MHAPPAPRTRARRFIALAAVAWLGLAAAPASAQALKVLTAGAFKQVVVALVPALEAKTGMKIEVANDTAGALVRKVQAGEPFDVLVLPPNGLATLGQEGHVDAASIQPVARVGIGVAVKAGSPRSALATVEQFKQAVLQARRVAYFDPAAGGSSGIYLSGLFERLGIAAEVRAKAVLVPGGLVAERLVTGEADLAIHQVSEILPVPGAELVGPLPESIQNYTTYASGVTAKSRSPASAEAARVLVQVLAGPEAAEVTRAKGMMPAPRKGSAAQMAATPSRPPGPLPPCHVPRAHRFGPASARTCPQRAASASPLRRFAPTSSRSPLGSGRWICVGRSDSVLRPHARCRRHPPLEDTDGHREVHARLQERMGAA